jgi:hypothetical protein
VLVPDYRIAVPPDPDKKESMTFFERLRQRQWNQWRGLGQDAPPALVAAAESIAARAEDDRRVLSVWTSSTWYYSGHPATWAGFNVPKYNTMLLDPSRLRAYQRYVLAEIGYVLVDNSRIVPDRKYGGVQYPETGILHLVDMLGSGVARVIYPDMDWLQDEFLQKGMPVFSNRNVPFLAIEIDAQRVLAEYVRLRDEGASGESGP